MKTIKVKIIGESPIMLGNPQLASPFNEYCKQKKALTSKKKKTDADLMEIARIEFIGSFYLDGDDYVIPAVQFEKSIYNASKEHKLGTKFEKSFGIVENNVLLRFSLEKKNPEELFDEGSTVDFRQAVVSSMGKQSRIDVVRPCIKDWSCEFTAFYDEGQLNEDQVKEAIEISGMRYGVGTYRKARFGRFNAEFK